jgi:hypothetical protein
MKDQKTQLDSEHLSEWNAATADPNSTKPKRKTVYIKLHPKPNAPRYSVLKPARAGLQPR